MNKYQSRRQFLRTSAGFSAILLAPGIWSCQRPKNEKRSYDFRAYQSDGQLAPVTIVTPEDGDFVHTYFDVTPFSPTRRYMVTSKLPFQDHLPELGVTAEVCVIDLNEQTIETVYTTKTWGFQTGTNAQWGKSDRYVYTNDLIEGKAVMIQIDLESGDTKAFSSSMYNISRNGEYGIGFPLELLNATQQGYGMPSPEVENPITLTEQAHKDEGVWRTDLKTGKSELSIRYTISLHMYLLLYLNPTVHSIFGTQNTTGNVHALCRCFVVYSREEPIETQCFLQRMLMGKM